MPRPIEKGSNRPPSQKTLVELDFSDEARRGKLHAQPSDCMQRIWDAVKAEGGALHIGTSESRLRKVGVKTKLGYAILMLGQNVTSLVIQGEGPGGVTAVSAIQLAYNDLFGVESKNTAADYVRMAREGAEITSVQAPGGTPPTREVKAIADEFSGHCRRVCYSRFPGTRTGKVSLARANVTPMSSIHYSLGFTDSERGLEVARLDAVRESLMKGFNRNIMLLALNMMASDRAGLTAGSNAGEGVCSIMGRLLPFLTASGEEPNPSLEAMRQSIKSGNPQVGDCLRRLADDVSSGRVGVLRQVGENLLDNVVEDSVKDSVDDLNALFRFRGEHAIQVGLIYAASTLLEEHPRAMNAELAVESAYTLDFSRSRQQVVKKARDVIQEALASEGSSLGLSETSAPKDSVIVSMNLPSITQIPLLASQGVKAILAVKEVSRLAHEKIVAKSMGIPLAGGFTDLHQIVRGGELLLIDDRHENTHMVVLLSPSEEIMRRYGVSMSRPVSALRVGKTGGLAKIRKSAEDPEEELFYLSGTLQLIGVDAMDAAARARPRGIGLIRSEIDLLHLGDARWLEFGSAESQRRLEEAYFKRACDAIDHWTRWDVGGGSLTFRLPDITENKMAPIVLHALEKHYGFKGEVPENISLANELLTRFPDDLMKPFINAWVRAIKTKFPKDFRVDGEIPQRKFKVFLEASVEDESDKETFFRYCQLGEDAAGVEGVFGRKAMFERKNALENIGGLLSGFDDCALGSSDLTKDALGIKSREDVRLDALNPKALLLINEIVQECKARGFSPQVCGPMAEDVYSLALLAGMGVRRVAVDPMSVDALASTLGKLDSAECERLLRHVTMRDAAGEFVYRDGEVVMDYLIAETSRTLM